LFIGKQRFKERIESLNEKIQKMIMWAQPWKANKIF
jgi:hypothetical protein